MVDVLETLILSLSRVEMIAFVCLQLHDHLVYQCSAARAQLASGIW